MIVRSALLKRAIAAPAAALLIGAVAVAVTAAPASAHPVDVTSSVPTPTVSGPVTGGAGAPSLALGTFPLSSVGYTESEYFLSGTATSYQNVGALGSDGVWSVKAAATAAYK